MLNAVDELAELRTRRLLKPEKVIYNSGDIALPVSRKYSDRHDAHMIEMTKIAEKEYQKLPKKNIPDMKLTDHSLNFQSWKNPFLQLTYAK